MRVSTSALCSALTVHGPAACRLQIRHKRSSKRGLQLMDSDDDDDAVCARALTAVAAADAAPSAAVTRRSA